MRNQCSWCGAPRTAVSAITPCKYCGTLAPIAEPRQSFGSITGAPALCVCQVIAVWRCVVCDSPVCAQHRNAFWPGQSRANIRLAGAAETSLWNYATNVSARELSPGAEEVCTCCRSAFAGSQLDSYRSIPRPFDTDRFRAMLQLARAGVEDPAFYRSLSSNEFLEALVAYVARSGWPPVTVARTWEVVSGKPVRVLSTGRVYAFKVRRRDDYLVVSLDEEKRPRFGARPTPGRSVAGPVMISFSQPAMPAPQAPAVVMRADKEPVLGRQRQRFTLMFRVPAPHPSALHIGTYADLLLPIWGKG
jgi:hypothetical protein